jgi:hypothetical protein
MGANLGGHLCEAQAESGSDKFWPNQYLSAPFPLLGRTEPGCGSPRYFLELTGSRGDEVPLKTLVILASFCQNLRPYNNQRLSISFIAI